MDAASTTASSYAAIRKALVARLTDHFTMLENADVADIFTPWMDPLTHVSFALENLLAANVIPHVNVQWLAREALEEVAANSPRPPWGETHQLTPLHALRGPVFAPGEEPYDLSLSGDHHCVMSTSSLPGLTDVLYPRVRRPLRVGPRRPVSQPMGGAARRVRRTRRSAPSRPVAVVVARCTRADGRCGGPGGTRFSVAIDGFGTVRIEEADPSRDLDLIHEWVTAERAAFWGMGALSRDEIAATYEFLDSVPTHHVYVVRLDDVPVALLQTYDPRADPRARRTTLRPGSRRTSADRPRRDTGRVHGSADRRTRPFRLHPPRASADRRRTRRTQHPGDRALPAQWIRARFRSQDHPAGRQYQDGSVRVPHQGAGPGAGGLSGALPPGNRWPRTLQAVDELDHLAEEDR